jgi:hypothetical protein
MKDNMISWRYRALIIVAALGLSTGTIPNPLIHETAQAQPTYAHITLDDPTPQNDASFGGAVSRVGDVDGDGVPDLLIGTPFQDVGANRGQGQAFVFSGATGLLIHTLDDPTPQGDARFGFTVSGIRDVNGDGVPDLLIGAPFQDVGANTNQGQAFVFSGATGLLLRTLEDPTPQANAGFGDALADAGDVNADEVPDLLIGAPFQNVGSNAEQGQAFVFSGATGLLLRTLDDPTPRGFARFGDAVSGVGDVDSDGVPDLLIGASDQDVDANAGQGQAFVFSGTTGLLIHTLDDPTPQGFAQFGKTMSGVGDVDGDGVPDLLIGAPHQDVGANRSQGRAFVFSGTTGILLRVLDDPTPQGDAQFGFAVAGIGDVNADGVPDLLIGAIGQDGGVIEGQGQAFVFSGATGLVLVVLDNPTPQRFAQFGFAVAGIGDVNADGVPDLLVGAPTQAVGANTDLGQVFLFVSPRLGRFAFFDPRVSITLRPGVNDDLLTLKARVAFGKISNGIDPVKEKVTIRIGTFRKTIPAGSFVGKASGFQFVGKIRGTPLRVVIRLLGATSFRITVSSRKADLANTGNPVPVTLRIGNDSRTRTVTAVIN